MRGQSRVRRSMAKRPVGQGLRRATLIAARIIVCRQIPTKAQELSYRRNSMPLITPQLRQYHAAPCSGGGAVGSKVPERSILEASMIHPPVSLCWQNNPCARVCITLDRVR